MNNQNNQNKPAAAPANEYGFDSSYYNWNGQSPAPPSNTATGPQAAPHPAPYYTQTGAAGQPPYITTQGPHATVNVPATVIVTRRRYVGRPASWSYRQWLIFRIVLSFIILGVTVAGIVLGTGCYTYSCRYHHYPYTK